MEDNGRGMQRDARTPPRKSVKLPKPKLGMATLRKEYLVDPDGRRSSCELLESAESGKTFFLIRPFGDGAIYGEVWHALEVCVDYNAGEYTPRLDVDGKKREFAVKRMDWDKINNPREKKCENPLHEIAALEILSEPGHPNVLKLVEALNDGGLPLVCGWGLSCVQAHLLCCMIALKE
ncbi:unnamed protein product [Discosporangium mesarthrocarpum]